MSSFGNKIVVVGVSASGKTTFSRKLSERLSLPVIFMDEIMWKPGWQYIGDEATVIELQKISAQSQWIIDGYISKDARTFVFERADTIIYLDHSPFVASWRYIKRWWKHRKDARPELIGSPEKFSFTFLKLIWRKAEAVQLDKHLANIEDQTKIVRLNSPKQAQNFLDKL